MAKQVKVLTTEQIDMIVDVVTAAKVNGEYLIPQELRQVFERAIVITIQYSDSDYYSE
jgi:hypothetical protein